MILFIVLTIILIVSAYLAWGICKVLIIDRKRYARYWLNKADEPVKPGAIRLVALGDSTFQSIGATRPELGTVGRVASYIERQTHRPVHVTNLSVWGAKMADVVDDQLSRADLKSADIIIVAVGANDALRFTDVSKFRDNAAKLMRSLPSETAVVADVAGVKNRDQYDDIINKLRVKRGLRRADLRWIFTTVKFSWQLSGRDFFHPSDYGYIFWFKSFQPEIDNIIHQAFLAKDTK